MNTKYLLLYGVGILLLAGGALACNGELTLPTPQPPVKPSPPPAAKAEVKRVPVDKKGNVVLEIEERHRRVLVKAEVCLREGQLEMLLCKRQSKEHESILTADVDARDIHMALEAAGTKAGRPVRYDPKYEPATGGRVKVSVQYEAKGKTVTVPAQHWIQNLKTKKDLEHDWVFAGSQFVPDPFDKNRPPYYLANDGDLICVSNFPSAMLDLPVASPKDNTDLAFIAHTARIPPEKTKVTVILEPVLETTKK